MRSRVVLALAAALLLVLAACRPDHGHAQRARLVRVIDGDTVVVRLAGRDERVRLIGVDAPELRGGTAQSRARARAARDWLVRLLPPGAPVRLERDPLAPDRDRWGRLLRYLYLPDGRLANLEIIRSGRARVLGRFPFTKLQQFQEATCLRP